MAIFAKWLEAMATLVLVIMIPITTVYFVLNNPNVESAKVYNLCAFGFLLAGGIVMHNIVLGNCCYRFSSVSIIHRCVYKCACGLVNRQKCKCDKCGWFEVVREIVFGIFFFTIGHWLRGQKDAMAYDKYLDRHYLAPKEYEGKPDQIDTIFILFGLRQLIWFASRTALFCTCVPLTMCVRRRHGSVS